MKRNISLYTEDILSSIKLTEQYLKNVELRRFLYDKKLQDAVTRRIEIIGEAMKAIPQNIKEKHPQIPWKEFSEIRNFLTHVYFGVNAKRLWYVIKKDLPELKKEIKRIID